MVVYLCQPEKTLEREKNRRINNKYATISTPKFKGKTKK